MINYLEIITFDSIQPIFFSKRRVWRNVLFILSALLPFLVSCAGNELARYPSDKAISEEVSLWLRQGPQSRVSSAITNIAQQISGITRRERLYNSIDYIWNNFHYAKRFNNKMFKRTAKVLFRDKKLGGCADFALVAATLFRASQIPTRLIMTANADWMSRYKKNSLHITTGHIFLEVYLEDEWYLVDPVFRFLFSEYRQELRSYPRREYFCLRGVDYWALGIYDIADLDKVYQARALRFDEKLYKDPAYPQKKI